VAGGAGSGVTCRQRKTVRTTATRVINIWVNEKGISDYIKMVSQESIFPLAARMCNIFLLMHQCIKLYFKNNFVYFELFTALLDFIYKLLGKQVHMCRLNKTRIQLVLVH